MTSEELKDQIDADITNQTADDSITPTLVGDNMKAVVDYADNIIGKVYKAKLAQSGTGNITATDLINNTGLTFTYSRSSVGNYSINFSTLLADLNKVDIIINFQQSSYSCPVVNIDNLNILATITTRYWNGTTFALSDEIINNATIYVIINN